MDAVNYALNHLKYTIDETILNLAFPLANQYDLSSLDTRIENKIIAGRIRPDLDTYGGRQNKVDVNKCNLYSHNDGTLIIAIPNDQLGGLEIAWPISLVAVNQSRGGLISNNNNISMVEAAQDQMIDSLDVRSIGSTDLFMLDPHTCWVRDLQSISGDSILNLMMTNSRNFSNLPSASHRTFALLVELATKSYLYNQRAKFIQNRLQSGFDQSIYESIVSEYSGAEELYQQTKKERWLTTAIFSDPVRTNNIVSGRIPT